MVDVNEAIGGAPIDFAEIKGTDEAPGAIVLDAALPSYGIPLIGVDGYSHDGAFNQRSVRVHVSGRRPNLAPQIREDGENLVDLFLATVSQFFAEAVAKILPMKTVERTRLVGSPPAKRVPPARQEPCTMILMRLLAVVPLVRAAAKDLADLIY
jgi:hypothetical protein